ncbi:hypothetical protein M011DRAFT_491781 [Sporormia fimetaria CBS 119925]|uniref:AAA protein C-terminal winged helix domain-containing protein n=1 Tax=Sporormia fimetaria CBS 119925 TaxID=1340428 RepID=A0A6A6VKT7_9PLEO|nr:hypothetical protein M011DRAFT_491781 [Sporormia fimetaria CBS 119925]
MPRSNQLPRRGWLVLPLSKRTPKRSLPPPFLIPTYLQPLPPPSNPNHSNDTRDPNGHLNNSNTRNDSNTQNDSKNQKDKQEDPPPPKSPFTASILEGSTIALLSLLSLALGGYAYNKFYKSLVLSRIESSFIRGAFSSNELVSLGRLTHSSDPKIASEALLREYWIPRPEQQFIDDIVSGKIRGRYFLLVGERGTGKRSLLLDAMRKVGGEGIAMLEAHSDPEVLRLRLGKALDFDYHEDYVGGLFSIRGPRDSSALLDIERALNKMEQVALRLREKRKKPLLLVINNVHLVNEDKEGFGLLEILQQRAEIWSSSDLVTTVFTSDENWTVERLTPRSTGLETVRIADLGREGVVGALGRYRERFFAEKVEERVAEEVYRSVGGRLGFLNQVVKAKDMLEMCRRINRREKVWFLGQCWVFGDGFGEEVVANQEFCAAAMILAREFVRRENPDKPGELPKIPLHEARQIIGRADYTQGLDHINVIHIDPHGMVRPDSVPMMNAFREIVTEEGFEEHLKATLLRMDELESLGRTRELTSREPPTYGAGEIPAQTYCARI